MAFLPPSMAAETAAAKALRTYSRFVDGDYTLLVKSVEYEEITTQKGVKEHAITAVAIVNGAGSREADTLVRDALKGAEIKDVARVPIHDGAASVSESGRPNRVSRRRLLQVPLAPNRGQAARQKRDHRFQLHLLPQSE